MSQLDTLIQLLAKLPGLGPRSARRAALHLLKRRESLLEPTRADQLRESAQVDPQPLAAEPYRLARRPQMHGRRTERPAQLAECRAQTRPRARVEHVRPQPGRHVSTGMLAQARGAYPDARWVRADARALPFTESFELAVSLARPGGRIANIGVHGEAATLHLEEQWIRDITITTGLVDTSSTPTLMRLISTGQIDAKPFITHHFDMDNFEEAYNVFARAADTGALKVVLTRGE